MTSPYVKAAAERAAKIGQHQPTELNPHGIYAPPGDPLHRHPWLDNEAIENNRLKALVVRVIAYLGLAALLAWALHFAAVSQ